MKFPGLSNVTNLFRSGGDAKTDSKQGLPAKPIGQSAMDQLPFSGGAKFSKQGGSQVRSNNLPAPKAAITALEQRLGLAQPTLGNPQPAKLPEKQYPPGTIFVPEKKFDTKPMDYDPFAGM